VAAVVRARVPAALLPPACLLPARCVVLPVRVAPVLLYI